VTTGCGISHNIYNLDIDLTPEILRLLFITWCLIRDQSPGIICYVKWYIGTNILQELAASIFRVVHANRNSAAWLSSSKGFQMCRHNT
jgi:hypothetical protein